MMKRYNAYKRPGATLSGSHPGDYSRQPARFAGSGEVGGSIHPLREVTTSAAGRYHLWRGLHEPAHTTAFTAGCPQRVIKRNAWIEHNGSAFLFRHPTLSPLPGYAGGSASSGLYVEGQ